MKKHIIEELVDNKFILAESPYYDPRTNTISFVDIVDKKLYLYKNNKLKSISFNEKIGSAVPLKKLGYIIFGEKNIFTYINDEVKVLRSLDGITDKTKRCNDATADSLGRIYFSTMVDDGIHSDASSLYRFSNREIICMDSDVLLGNGIAFSSDNKKMFYIDTKKRAIYSYDYDIDSGYIDNKKELCIIHDGFPDGMTIDKKDNLFISIWEGSRIEVRSSKTGILKDVINIPTKLVTSCTFINENYDTLLVTTSSINDNNIGAGKVYKIKVDYTGKEENYAIID